MEFCLNSYRQNADRDQRLNGRELSILKGYALKGLNLMITEDISRKIDEVSDGIWSSMVDLPVTLCETPGQLLHFNGRVTSSVQIVGCWHGAVRLDMGSDLARQATASLLGASPEELSHDDVRDAAGELANMTAGGIKELLPQPCQMSLPTVVMGTDYEVSVPQGVVLYRSVFNTAFGSFSVTIIRGEEAQVPSGQRMHHEKNPAPHAELG